METSAGSPPGLENVQESGGEDVKEQARQKAEDVRGQAQEKVREQVDQRSTQAGEQVSSTAQDLRTVGEELRKQGKDTPAKLADQAAERTERIGGYLQDSDPDRILHDVEDFGRRQPWAVALGGIAVGLLAARFLKASSSQRYEAQSPSSNGIERQPVPPPVGNLTETTPVAYGDSATAEAAAADLAPAPGVR